MIVKLKRIYSYYIEVLAILVMCFFAYQIIGTGLFLTISDSFKTSKYMYMYVLPILEILVLLYLCFRNVFKGQSILQAMFGIKYNYKNRKQLIFKNIIDLCLLPISIFTVLIWNRSVGDFIFNISVVEEMKNNKSSNSFLYIMMAWFTIMPLILCIAFGWRVNRSEQEFRFHLNNTQTIKDNVGFIKDFSFNNKVFWTQYDKDGEYTSATLRNNDNKKFKIKIYHNEDDFSISYFVIDGERYEYEIERFDLNDYTSFIEEFKEEIKVNEINSEKDALEAAKAAYEIINSKVTNNYAGYELFYDKENNCYMVIYVSSINYDILGGCYNIIIQEDGQVLAMFGGE